MTGEAIDHNTIRDDKETPDTSADPEGAEVRENVERPDIRQTPPWVTEIFEWRYTGMALEMFDGPSDPEYVAARRSDKNWSLKPLISIVQQVESEAAIMAKAAMRRIHNDEDNEKLYKALYKQTKDYLTLLSNESTWMGYGTAIALLAQGAKEVSSGTRFALKAEEWISRIRRTNGEQTDGPSNMLMAATEQIGRGTVFLEAVRDAYADTSNEDARELVINWRNAAYTTMNIEAKTEARKWDHPGKSESASDATTGAGQLLLKSLRGE